MKYYIENLKWKEFEAVKHETTVILPVGSLEQHGPQAPLGVDSIIAEGLSHELAKEINGLVAPTIKYGIKPIPSIGTGSKYSGNIYVKGETLKHNVKDVLTNFIVDGVKKFFVVEGHWENDSYILEAIEELMDEYADVKIIFAAWWNNIGDDVIEKVYDGIKFPGFGNSHAEVMETSMVMYFKPETIDLDLLVNEGHDEIKKFWEFPIPEDYVPASGLNAPAYGSSCEKGKLLVDEVVRNYVAMARKVY